MRELTKETSLLRESTLKYNNRITKGNEFVEGLEKKLKAKKELSLVEEKIQLVEDTNIKATAYEKAYWDKEGKKEKEKEYDEYTTMLSDYNLEKANQLSEAKLPVDGLEITLEGLFFKGTRCNNWSKSESLDIARDLLKARNPELKAVFFDQGNDFDSQKLKNLQQWGIDNDMQAILTIVSDVPEVREDDDNAYYIVEGELV